LNKQCGVAVSAYMGTEWQQVWLEGFGGMNKPSEKVGHKLKIVIKFTLNHKEHAHSVPDGYTQNESLKYPSNHPKYSLSRLTASIPLVK